MSQEEVYRMCVIVSVTKRRVSSEDEEVSHRSKYG